jgi:8-oxo-dGTP pyrophosphatase MutT (NUDIX family)
MSDDQRRVGSLPEAVVAVITKESKVLLIQRGPDVPGAGCWAPLSGKVEAQEDQAAALVREVREEVGLTVRPVRKWENIAASGSHKLHWWLAEWVSGDFKLDPREVVDARWLGVDEVFRLERTFEGDREFFKSVFPLL